MTAAIKACTVQHRVVRALRSAYIQALENNVRCLGISELPHSAQDIAAQRIRIDLEEGRAIEISETLLELQNQRLSLRSALTVDAD
ncbi:MAG: hypothetical protein M9955_26390 [Rhizobiaceae bacterium]|uniref:hypothetical protein n=1 Tax=unclassified Shinella TaxID=2643062 RepID=UPI00234E992A|nr:hypothetical protein [Shinella sp. YE25]MCO5085177.1 hypothetical protein [Rhizobiaceae bacterium]MDC7255748.1 hypothetical protein [Shinella sp. YE25]